MASSAAGAVFGIGGSGDGTTEEEGAAEHDCVRFSVRIHPHAVAV